MAVKRIPTAVVHVVASKGFRAGAMNASMDGNAGNTWLHLGSASSQSRRFYLAHLAPSSVRRSLSVTALIVSRLFQRFSLNASLLFPSFSCSFPQARIIRNHFHVKYQLRVPPFTGPQLASSRLAMVTHPFSTCQPVPAVRAHSRFFTQSRKFQLQVSNLVFLLRKS